MPLKKYVELAELQYRAGSINYIEVLDAQRRYLDAQIGLTTALRNQNIALVNLYKAIGGGWQIINPQNNRNGAVPFYYQIVINLVVY